MASKHSLPVQKLKGDSTCPFCLELFKAPQLLSCLHSICLRCAKDVARNTDTVQCPECGHNTPMQDLRGDFKTANFVESYKLLAAELNATTNTHAVQCQLCEERPAAYNCENCGIIVCQTCRKIHVKTASCLEDHLVTLASVLAKSRQELQQQKVALEQYAATEQVSFDRDAKDMDDQRQDALNAIEQQKKDALQHFKKEKQKVNSNIDRTKKARTAEHDECQKKIRGAIECISSMEQLKDENMAYVKRFKEIKEKLQAEITNVPSTRFSTPQVIISNRSFDAIKANLISVQFELSPLTPDLSRSSCPLEKPEPPLIQCKVQPSADLKQYAQPVQRPSDSGTKQVTPKQPKKKSAPRKRPGSPPRPSTMGPPPSKTIQSTNK